MTHMEKIELNRDEYIIQQILKHKGLISQVINELKQEEQEDDTTE